MKGLNSESVDLLDRIYNLRTQDSTVLADIEKDKDRVNELKNKTSELKAEIEDKISEITSMQKKINKQAKDVKELFAKVKKDQFAELSEALNIDFNPEVICHKIDMFLPDSIGKLETDKERLKEQLVKIDNEYTSAVIRYEELGFRYNEAIKDQERLERFINQALDSNINATREEIVSLLAKFGFSFEEQRSVAKLLMFPEDGLIEYNSALKDKLKVDNNVMSVDVKAEKLEDKDKKEEIKEEKIETPTIEEAKPLEEEKEEIVIKEDAPKTREEFREEKLSQKDEIIKFLKDNGYDYLEFTNDEFEKIVSGFDEGILSKNIALIDALGIEKDFFYGNASLLVDYELENKINKLKELGKMPKDIYLNANVLAKYNYKELESAIDTLRESGLDPKSVPLMAY